jgi:hypothetical protein
MATFPHNTTTARKYRGVGVASVALGFLGLVFLFVAPLGAVLSAAGFLAGIVGSALAWPERRPGLRWAVWGTLLSLVALVLNLAILRGWATWYPYPLYGGW